jgi:L-alanine-DL-glutamate epimerase-like enolase superfamily enzyme
VASAGQSRPRGEQNEIEGIGRAMKITRIEVYSYRLRYEHGNYVMSQGREATHETGTLVRIATSDAIDGWGEITPLGSTYLPTYVGSIRAALKTLGEALLGHDPTNIGRISRVMDMALMGHGYAKSALEIACWDIFGKVVGRPLTDLIGGRLNDDFPLYEAVPMGTPAQMAEFVHARGEAGITRFQLKVGGDPTDDIARVVAARAAAPASAIIVADSNGGWQLLQARRAIRGMEGLDVLVEQPCRDTPECALAHRGSTLPMVLDESVVTVADLFAARDAGALAVNLKVSRVGGLARTVQMRDLAQELGLCVSVEDMWGGDVITAAVSHLAASTSPEHLMNVSFFNDWTDGHVAGHEPRSNRGRGRAPSAAGLGIEVDTHRLDKPIFVATG